MIIKTTEQYNAMKELAYVLDRLGVTDSAMDDITYTYGDQFEECSDCGYVIESCECNDHRYFSPYDDEASFE